MTANIAWQTMGSCVHCCLLMRGPGLRELACPRSERLTLQFPLVVSMHAALSQLNLNNGLCGPWALAECLHRKCDPKC